jgi:O-antigen/teichoic acid export membrane protein
MVKRVRAGASTVVESLRSMLLRPVGRLTIGSAAAQALGLLLSPLTARIFAPADSGAAAVFVTLLSVPVALASLRYDAAIAVPATRAERSAMLKLSLLIAPAVGLVTLLVLLVLRDRIPGSLSDPKYALFVWYAPLLVVCVGWAQAVSAWAYREGMFDQLAAVPIRRSAQQMAFQLLVGWWSRGAGWVLVLGHAIGSAGGGMRIWRAVRESVLGDWQKSDVSLRTLAVRFKSFPLLNAPGAGLNLLGAGLPLLGIGALHGAEAAGFFRWAQLLFWIPLAALVQALGSVYGASVARMVAEDVGQLLPSRHRVTGRLLALTGVVSVMAFTLPTLVPIVFGARWAESGTLAILSLPAVAASIVTTPTGCLPTLGRNDLQFWWEASRLALTAGAYLFCKTHGTTLRESTLVFALALCVGYVAHFALNEWVLRRVSAGHFAGRA